MTPAELTALRAELNRLIDESGFDFLTKALAHAAVAQVQGETLVKLNRVVVAVIEAIQAQEPERARLALAEVGISPAILSTLTQMVNRAAK